VSPAKTIGYRTLNLVIPTQPPKKCLQRFPELLSTPQYTLFRVEETGQSPWVFFGCIGAALPQGSLKSSVMLVCIAMALPLSWYGR
jgi:hypothetical protein